MRLGGFVLFRNNVGTLRPCLESLQSLCDEVVAVDSGASDGSASLARRLGARVITHRWEGFGSARARAARELANCDAFFFLDSDEYLLPHSSQQLKACLGAGLPNPYYRVPIHEWAQVAGRRFVFRIESPVRVVRADAACWAKEMIVHEALPHHHAPALDVRIEHEFAPDPTHRAAKNQSYALLWALQAHLRGAGEKSPAFQRLAHTLRNALLKGALFRGGLAGLRLSWQVAAYHAQKYEYLRQVKAGAFDPELQALKALRLTELFERVAKHAAARELVWGALA